MKNIDLIQDIDKQAGISGYPHQISQVITHFLYKACTNLSDRPPENRKKSKITITASTDHDGSSGMITFVISDNSRQEVSFIDKKYENRSYTDNLCYKIIEQHGGSINSSSSLNSQSLIIKLPGVASENTINKLRSKSI